MNSVTAPVTEVYGPHDPWRIPEFLARTTGTPARERRLAGGSTPSSRPSRSTPDMSPIAPVSPAVPGDGGSAGSESAISLTTDFEKFRVDPQEIETTIKREADRRWREWLPTKESRKRPRLSWYVRQVRKEYYP